MNNFNASEEFVVGKHKIGYVGDDFKKHFGKRDFSQSSMPTFKTLTERLSDEKIESDLRPGMSTLGDVLAFIDGAGEEFKDGKANIFYFTEAVVCVFWIAWLGVWGVGAYERDGYVWRAGRRVFSTANSASTACTHCSLESRILDLESRVVKLEKVMKNQNLHA